jgi:hypothetical protein
VLNTTRPTRPPPPALPQGCGPGCQYANQVLDYSSEYLFDQVTPTHTALVGSPDVYPRMGSDIKAGGMQGGWRLPFESRAPYATTLNSFGFGV